MEGRPAEWANPGGETAGASSRVVGRAVPLCKSTKTYKSVQLRDPICRSTKPTKTYNYEHKNVTKVHKNVTKVTITSRKARNAAGGPAICGTVYFFYCIFFTVPYFFLLYCIFFYKSYNCEQESYNCEPFALQLRAKNLQKNLQLRATKSTKGGNPSWDPCKCDEKMVSPCRL